IFEEGGDTLDGPRNRMQTTDLLAAPRQRHIDRLASQARRDRRRLQLCLSGIECGSNPVPGLVDPGADDWALFGTETPQLTHLLTDRTFFAQMLRFLVLELYQVSRARTRAQRYLYQFFQSVHQELQHALNTNSSTGQKRRKLAFRAQISLRGINTKGMNKKGKEPQPFPLRTHAPARMGGINTQSNGLRQGCLCLLYNGRKC